jgi:carboxyl-terminal processing protease
MRFKYMPLWLLVLGTFLFSPLQASGTSTYLKPEHVHDVMKEILELHVSENSISKKIMQRALRVYIEQFDINRIYLLNNEVSEYWDASDSLLEKSIKDYKNQNFFVFEQLDTLFKESILRNRLMRPEAYQDALSEFSQKTKQDIIDRGFDRSYFSSSQEQLKARTAEDLIAFIFYQESLIDEPSGEKRKKIASLFEKHLFQLENNYLFVNEQGQQLSDQQQQHIALVRIAKSLAKSLDSHTAFYSPEEAYDLRVRLEKGFFGLGIILQESIDGIEITKIIEKSPADISGKLAIGDHLVSVDGQLVEKLSFRSVLDLIRGVEGSSIVLEVQHSEEKEFSKVHLKRGKVVLNEDRVDVSHEKFGNGIIGKIKLYSFYEGEDGISSEKDIKAALKELKSQGKLNGLVLDLRDNSGGFLLQAVKVAGLFITNGVVVVSKYSDGFMRNFRDVDGKVYYNGPLVVLTSKASASAAEIVAQALQDYGTAVVVGDNRTYGKGSIQHQTVIDGQDPLFYKVTVGRYYTVSGKSTQISGVNADISVPTLYSQVDIGEKFTDYPLPSEKIAPVFKDKLEDIEPSVRSWFKRFYLPSLQARVNKWHKMLPTLRENSAERIASNPDYQIFLKRIGGEIPSDAEEVDLAFGAEDLQLEEAVDIVKDMLVLSYEKAQESTKDALATQSQQ